MILCCGEALIDMLPFQTPDGQAGFVPHAGGAVFNTAIALGRLGRSTGYFGALSTDLFGAQLRHSLAQAGVDARLCPRVDRPTTLAFVQLVAGQARYAFYDENTAGRLLAVADLPPLPAEISTLFFGGISLVVEPCAKSYETLMQQAQGTRVIMMDPNIRPGFVRDERAYRARLMRMLAGADIIKLSDEDMRWLYPGHTEQAVVAALRAAGTAVVLITKGADGASAHGPNGQLDLPALAVPVVDTVGAGDSFNAGFLASLDEQGFLGRAMLRQLPAPAMAQALHQAIRVAALTVSKAGANPPSLAELQAF